MKFIEAHDFHASPDWLELSEQLGRAVRDAAIKNKVAFIATSDFWDKPVYATNKGGFPRIKSIVDSWLEVCPVVVVQGTPSHDAPGCYDALPGVTVIQAGQPQVIAGVQVHGIPELRKDQLQAQLGLPAEQANAETMAAFRAFIRDVVAPQRAAWHGPAVALLHGNVTDSTLTGDVILRASDLVIHTEDLRPACMDRWSLGHIHTPWESSNLFGGYCGFPGMDSNPWGKTGFVPAMNLVDLDTLSLERIPYGTPMRRKITAPLAQYAPDVAYWLETEDPSAVCPPGHAWNRLTVKEVKKDLQRPIEPEYQRTLAEWFAVANPEVSEPIITKVETLTTSRAAVVPVDLSVEFVEVIGCDLFKGRRATLDLSSAPEGLNVIKGPNGAGKSSLLAFCHPYPTVLGKDTDSGRPSAIKDFFSAKDSVVRKVLSVNGVRHEHLITIKGAHTKSPKTECYLTIEGVNVLDTASFDEMMAECERRYGPYDDYRITTFYEQPLQSRNSRSGIMTASMTDIRDVVQNIAGVDRESEKVQALAKAKELEAVAVQLEAKLAGAAELLENPEELESLASDQTVYAQNVRPKLEAIEAEGKQAGETVAALEAMKARQDRDAQRARELTAQVESLKARRLSVEVMAAGLEENRLSLLNDDDLKAQAVNAKERARWDQSRAELSKALEAVEELATVTALLSDHDKALQRERLEERIGSFQPCPKCGYLADDMAERFADLKAQIDQLAGYGKQSNATELKAKESTLRAMVTRIPLLQAMTEPVYLPVIGFDGFPLGNRSAVESAIKAGETAGATLAGINESLTQVQSELTRLSAESYPVIGLDDARANYTRLKAEWSKLSSAIHEAEGRAKALRESAERAVRLARELEDSKTRFAKVTADLEDWRYIAKMLQPTKIPALEMELVVDSIDATAGRVLDDGRQYRTETDGCFDIKVYDPERGIEKSLLKHSPGEKAFLSDAYVKALIQARNNREHRRYSPVIQDESDGPIQPERLRAYYAQQERFYKGTKVLVVTHNAESHQMIDNVIEIEEVLF